MSVQQRRLPPEDNNAKESVDSLLNELGDDIRELAKRFGRDGNPLLDLVEPLPVELKKPIIEMVVMLLHLQKVRDEVIQIVPIRVAAASAGAKNKKQQKKTKKKDEKSTNTKENYDQSLIPLGAKNKLKTKEKTSKTVETAENIAPAEIEQTAITKSAKKKKNKNKTAKNTNKTGNSAENSENTQIARPETSTVATKKRNKKQIKDNSAVAKGKTKAVVRQKPGAELFSAHDIEYMWKVQGYAEHGVENCQEAWDKAADTELEE
ncbi:hypothetical protein CORC01_00947 [Colletotrichum orchidophilum]|uniref:Uncharacterized protein n=1 Tax=Colletotrichum orchidophilum TaxID=1209926 RepID=A0A1G4BQM0_9PEZI|nr:uncharacterized protein CORC01_00947 [Colletotrichum orchidophilum]OHF03628.1 hypothetical protein CORC01_00947 [Colletotrichum orchidophilum]